MNQRLYDSAIEDFEKTIQIQPNLKGLYSNLGVAWYYKKEYKKAIENYDREIFLSPESHFAYFNRAICRAELEEHAKSLEDIDKTLTFLPGLYPALCLKGDLLVRTNQPVKARTVYEKAVSLNPDQVYAKNRLARLKSDSTLKTIPATDPFAGSTQKTYELQVGAYRIKTYAGRMKDHLKELGIDTRLITLTTKESKPWYLLRTGSYSSYPAAKTAKDRFKERIGMDVLVKQTTQF